MLSTESYSSGMLTFTAGAEPRILTTVDVQRQAEWKAGTSQRREGKRR